MNKIGKQTIINGITVSKMVETVNILNDSLGKDEQSLIQDNVNN